ncbi:glycosyltransferase [Sphingomonas montanisoli]|uniref:Glycosyltransferase n=1 Tax=Sphingomonas montanisoli TaxID=2606412 RepID=A0A5D9CBS9_9SPHN|nr:glycosyltransferase [Sphingomonas montanisoli]TZG27525.1 glycosyltransferase [Sphingomonas montanisoli]
MTDIIIYVHDLRSSGVVRDAIRLADHCAERHRVTLVAGHGDGFFRDLAGQGRHDFVALCKGRRSPVAMKLHAALALRRWLAGRPAALIVSMGNMGHATPFLATLGARRHACVYRISNEIARGDGLRGALRTIWMKALIADAVSIPLVGAALARNPIFADALADGRAVEMRSGVDLAEARAKAAAPSPHVWLDEDVPVILAIGRLRPQKNHELLIAAMARLDRPARLVILGGGTDEERARYTRIATEAGLKADAFLLAGETDNVFAWLSRAKLFALPSRWEGSSVALIEAMAVGTPIVASTLAGDAREVLDHGRYGRLFDGDDPDALARAIEAQLSDGVIGPGDRALAYASPDDDYRALFETRIHQRFVERRSRNLWMKAR